MFRGIDFVFLWICVACLVSSRADAVPTKGPLIDLATTDSAAISQMSPPQHAGLAEDLTAKEIKSGLSILAHLGKSITSMVSKASAEIQNKDRLVREASALIYSASSKTSEQSIESYEIYEPHNQDWSLKESIMNTLHQALNAITDGVTIVKGYFIKGGDALASLFGKVIPVEEIATGNSDQKIISSTMLRSKKLLSTVVPPLASQYGTSIGNAAPTAPAYFTTPTVLLDYGEHWNPSQTEENIECEVEPTTKDEENDSPDATTEENDYETDNNENFD